MLRPPRFSAYLVTISVVLTAPTAARRQEDYAVLLSRAESAYRQGDAKSAISLATKAIEMSKGRAEGWLLRAKLYDGQHDYANAAADCSEVIKLDPKNAAAWQRRGEENFKLAKFADSVSDFDRYLALVPEQKPYHWQRGISLYYAGRFAEGKQQFELHRTVNPNDVENAVWHFLCAARASGLESAKRGLIPIEGDTRVPMAQIHALFAGKASVDDVLKAARDAQTRSGAGEPMFYANLYLGLYYEALNQDEKAGEFIMKAAERWKENGYMGDVARVHAGRLRKKRPKPLYIGILSWLTQIVIHPNQNNILC